MSALRKLSTMGFERGLLDEIVLGARKRCRREIPLLPKTRHAALERG
jgi:hypothetical protein